VTRYDDAALALRVLELIVLAAVLIQPALQFEARDYLLAIGFWRWYRSPRAYIFTHGGVFFSRGYRIGRREL
jgi:hypothetical protein